MKRLSLLLSIAVMLIASTSFAQTTVTLQVTDADSQNWNNGSFSVTQTPLVTPAQGPLISSTLGATGGATLSLSPATYNFKVCPAAAAKSSGVIGVPPVLCYATAVAISGSTQTVTLTPNGPRFTPSLAGVSIYAYNDTEISNPSQGNKYYNLTYNVERMYNGSSWNNEGPLPPSTFANLSFTCGVNFKGFRTTVTDSTVAITSAGSAVTVGGGSNIVPVFCDGTSLKIE